MADDTCSLALEVIISFGESRSQAMSKMQGYIEQTLDICVSFFMELNHYPEAWAEEEDYKAEDELRFTNGKVIVHRICRCITRPKSSPSFWRP